MTEDKIREIVREELQERVGSKSQGSERDITLGLKRDEFELLMEVTGYAAGALAADRSVSEERSRAAAKLAEDLKWRATHHTFFYKAL